MNLKKETLVIIPAYNEEGNIGKVLKKLKKAGWKEIIVIDDYSADRTSEVVKKEKVKLIRHSKNQGQGASLRTGIKWGLKQKKYKYFITFDADGQHRVEDIEAMIKPLIKGKYDISLGTRFKGKGRERVPLGRKIIIKGAIIFIGIIHGIWLTDAHNGLRCLSRKAAEKIKITSDRMEHASEIIEEIRRNKLKYVEVPVIINYSKERMKTAEGGIRRVINVILGTIKIKMKRR